MPFYAFDGVTFVHALDARPQKQYLCLECKGVLHLRKGKWNLPHFYHVKKSSSCRLHSKGDDHLLLQMDLQKRFREKEVFLEFPFFEIYRIGDVVWKSQKIVFEIQCSPLKLEEAKARVLDYQKLGYNVVWLLDDRLFNQRSVSDVEVFFRQHRAYFISFKKKEKPFIYDQLDEIQNGKRWIRSRKIPVDPTRPLEGGKSLFPLQQKKKNTFSKTFINLYLRFLYRLFP